MHRNSEGSSRSLSWSHSKKELQACVRSLFSSRVKRQFTLLIHSQHC